MYNTLWDPNDDKERLFDKFNKYYGEFSDDVREDMQSRNVQEPTSVYDVLYPEARKSLLIKNVPKTTDIIEDTEAFRQAALNKIVPVITDIEELSETYRIAQLTKNVVSESSVLEISERYRLEQLAKNEPIGAEPHLSKSKDFREQMLSKNVSNPSDIEEDTQGFRQDQLSKNVPKTTDIEQDTEAYRDAQLSNNVSKTTDIEQDTERFRQDQLSKNVPNVSDIEEDTQDYRDGQLSKNVPNVSDIEKDTEGFRQDQLSKNVDNPSDIEQDTQAYRDGQLSKNVPNPSDIEEDTESYRRDQLGKNVPNPSDIEQDTEGFRQDQLSKNVDNPSDIEQDTQVYRDAQLGNNVPSSSDLEADSEVYRDNQLGNTVPSNSDLEADSEAYRDNQLGNTVPSNSDLERDSEAYRETQLGNTVPSESDLERDSVPFREGDLGNNVPIDTDLETDSVPFRDSNLSNNVPSESDLETDSVPFREDDLSYNVPNNSNLETDSIPFREDDLSNNVPSESDLEIDSVPFREDDLANNVPSESDLEIDSVPFREDDLANNVPSESDLLEDSIPFREDDLSNNVPSESDLEIDSVPFREDDLSNNVPSESDLSEDSNPYRDALLAFNVGAVSDLLDDTEPYRQEQLSSNVPTSSNILSDTAEARRIQLSKNLQGGLFGINIEGFGTQAFVGVSRNFSFGILVREALLARNDYRPGMPFSEGTQYRDKETEKDKIEASLFVSDDGVSTARSKIKAMHLRNGQNSLGYRNWTRTGGVEDLLSDLAGNVTDVAAAFKTSTINNIGDEPQADDLVAKSQAGNPLDTTEFAIGPKSIKSVIDKIANDSTVRYAQNYRIGQTEFVTGTGPDGAPKLRKQRYSVSNLYAPEEAGELLFSMTNYAIDNLAGQDIQLRTMYFPPYIQSFQETEEANWNETNMLGRPEAIYTYNNARRSGSINFYVLTDFAQEVELGLVDNGESLEPLMFDFDKEGIFTELSDDDKERIKGIQQDIAKLTEIEKQIGEDNKALKDIEANYNTPEASAASAFFTGDLTMQIDMETKINPIRERVNESNKKLASLSKSIGEKLTTVGKDIGGDIIDKTRFSENYTNYGNIYHPGNLLDYQQNPTADSEITSIKNVENVLLAMKKDLGFQPAFFSGDKVDFRRRMSFLSKLTRPKENDRTNTKVGFSFTTPPVAHLRLGDWLDHDCIVNSISKDYSDTVWCLQRGKVQPLWAAVTVSFTIIGPYGTYKAKGKDNNNSYRPLTATDVGGYYSHRSVW